MNMRQILHYTYAMAEAAPGGAPPAPPAALAKITLPGGAIVEVPKADAEAFHAAQQKANETRDDLARKAGAAEAERSAAVALAATEARDKEAIKLATSGEVAKARELLTAESNARLAKVGTRIVTQEIEGAVRRALPNVDAAGVADMVALVAPRAAYNADTGAVAFVDAAGVAMTKEGKAVDADAYLTDFLSTRKHFQPARVPNTLPGGPTLPPGAPGTIKRADVANMTPAQSRAMVAGLLKVVD